MASVSSLLKQTPKSCRERNRDQHNHEQKAETHRQIQPEKAHRLRPIDPPARPNLLRVVDQAMEVCESQSRDQIKPNARQNNPKQHGRHNRRNPSRRDVERRMDHRPMSRRSFMVRREVEVAHEAFRYDSDQPELQIGSPGERPEEELSGSLNGK